LCESKRCGVNRSARGTSKGRSVTRFASARARLPTYRSQYPQETALALGRVWRAAGSKCIGAMVRSRACVDVICPSPRSAAPPPPGWLVQGVSAGSAGSDRAIRPRFALVSLRAASRCRGCRWCLSGPIRRREPGRAMYGSRPLTQPPRRSVSQSVSQSAIRSSPSQSLSRPSNRFLIRSANSSSATQA
jgi:hypothetical protein